MAELPLNSLQESGARFDYITDIQVLKAAHIDPLGWLEAEDRPAGCPAEHLETSSEAVEKFWSLASSHNPTDRMHYDAALDARRSATEYLGGLIGTVEGYRLGYLTEDNITLYRRAHPDTVQGDETVLELELVDRAPSGNPTKNREIPEALPDRGGTLQCPLEVKPEDIRALTTVANRISDVLSRMDPIDMSIG